MKKYVFDSRRLLGTTDQRVANNHRLSFAEVFQVGRANGDAN
jgi:hypothetical protein